MKHLSKRWAAVAIRNSLAVFVALALGNIAVAAPIVDQSNLFTLPPGESAAASGVGGGTQRIQAQTVTAGVSGNLTRVDLQLLALSPSRVSSVVLAIYDRSRIDPGARLVGELSIDPFGLPTGADFESADFVSIDTRSLGLDVDVGDIFSLELRATGASSIGWVFGQEIFNADGASVDLIGISYAGGTNYVSERGGAFAATIYDRGFRTFVDPITVPEPAGVALIGLGMVGLALVRRRRARLG